MRVCVTCVLAVVIVCSHKCMVLAINFFICAMALQHNVMQEQTTQDGLSYYIGHNYNRDKMT